MTDWHETIYRARYDWRPYEMQDAIEVGCGCWRPN